MERTTLFADVILPLPLPGTYTYRVPYELNNQISIGCRVVVQFGKRKIYTALVYHIHKNVPQSYTPKYLLSLLDDTPLVNNIQFDFWEKISSYYLCRLGEVMNAALPSAFKLASESKIVINPSQPTELTILNEKEQILLQSLKNRKILSINEASNIVEQKKIIPLIKNLIEKKIILLEEEIKDKYKPKIEICVRISDKYSNDDSSLHDLMDKLNKKAPQQLALLMSYINLMFNKPNYITRNELLKSVNGTHQQLNALIKKEVFSLYEVTISRLGQYDSSSTVESIILNEYQDEALKEIENNFSENKTVLLHGVTSSGKTELYIKLINKTIAKGQQALMLLPEIALTTQIINRLRKYFGNKVGVFHSKYNEHERAEIWSSIANWKEDDVKSQENYSIILGARSAVFLPFKKLGLIIVDEEHDSSYKQFDPAPRYNARDTAAFLANLHNANLLLGSATPSFESYFNTVISKYGLVSLDKRYGNVKMPEIVVTNQKTETKKHTAHSHFSELLIQHIADALDAKEQVILFQNRRGFSLRSVCRECGWTPQCCNCDVSLVYHKNGQKLRCHYCGYNVTPPERCPACGSSVILMKGFGTEKIEEELSLIFPNAQIARMDLDSTRSKFSYQNIISDFEEKKIDILVGTQMVTKGLDFDNVSIAGILDADNMLTFPDFRAFERSFQLMAQVSGRSGRKNKQGKVIIQAINPNHKVIQQVINNDFIALFNDQLPERKKFLYPPFYRLIKITLKHKDLQILENAATYLASTLKKSFGKSILGPENSIIPRIKNYFLKDIIIKLKKDNSIPGKKTELLRIIDEYNKCSQYRSVFIVIDVDPQ